MKMIDYVVNRIKLAALAIALLACGGLALAANSTSPPSGLILTSPVVVNGSFSYNGGPQTSAVPASGGTFTCTSSGAITVTNTNVTANSVFLFGTKTAGSPAAFNVTTVTVGTSFIVTCGSGDTSVYNYIILG
jgi:hypothetical protein